MTRERGQSLIETLVALTVMIIGIAGAVSLGILSIRAGQTSELDVVAENLAREGIEAARAVRDYNWSHNQDWDTHLSSGDYRVIVGEEGNPGSGQVELESGPAQPELGDHFYHLCLTSDGQYLHLSELGALTCAGNGLEETAFNRLVTVEMDPDHSGNVDKMRITCEVLRSAGIGDVTYTVAEDLYNWYPHYQD